VENVARNEITEKNEIESVHTTEITEPNETVNVVTSDTIEGIETEMLLRLKFQKQMQSKALRLLRSLKGPKQKGSSRLK
jgi:hypothetical protein